jgi:hypothetical protein
MKTYRKTAVIVGIFFIIGTVSGILSGVVTAPITAGSTYPLNISASETQWLIGTLLILLMGFPLAMIPVLLYPLFKKHNEVLALGAVLFRGVLEMVSARSMARPGQERQPTFRHWVPCSSPPTIGPLCCWASFSVSAG